MTDWQWLGLVSVVWDWGCLEYEAHTHTHTRLRNKQYASYTKGRNTNKTSKVREIAIEEIRRELEKKEKRERKI